MRIGLQVAATVADTDARYESALVPNLERQETKVAVSLAGDELELFVTNTAGVTTRYIDESGRRDVHRPSLA
jgi:hypothetical protein